jgi:hypothetical protein
MAFTPDTPAALEQDQIAAYGTRFTGRDLHTESFLGKLSRAEAQGLWAAQQKLYRISHDAIPNSSSTYDALAAWAVAVGLSDGSTSYGPKAATIATGGIGTVTGSNGSAIPNGTQMVAPDGVTLFATTALQTIAGGTATLTFNAVTPGAAGNLTVPTTLTFTSGVPGVTNAITLTNPLAGGADKESAPALLARLLLRLQNPPKAITASDIRQLVQGLSGVDRAYVYPRRYGTGTADVVFTQAGTGAGRVPWSTTAAQAALDAARNVGCEQLRALVPTITTTSGSHNLQVRAVPATGYAFDWDSTAGAWIVSSSTASTITVNTAMPADFIAAVGSSNKLRIQVRTTGVVLPQVLTVTAIDGTFKILTISGTFIAPTAGDPVHAGSSFVTPIATALLSLVDALGPSKMSGYNDAVTDSWIDTLDPYQMARAALDVVDATTGIRYLGSLVATPTIDGAATALQAPDAFVTAPAILVARSILVTP